MNANDTMLDVPAWRKPVVAVPLNQAFPELESVKEFRSKQCIFNHDRSQVFNVVSNRYQVINHADAVDTVQQALHEAFGEEVAPPKVSVLGGGARIIANFSLPFIKPVEVRKGDVVAIGLSVYNAHDYLWRFSAQLSALRLVCTNGATIGRAFGSVSAKHFPSTGNPEVLRGQLKLLVAKGALLTDVWQEWESTKMSLEEATRLVGDDLFPQKMLKPILQEDRFPRSKWDFYNDLTAFATHKTKTLNRRVEFDETIASLFYRKEEMPA